MKYINETCLIKLFLQWKSEYIYEPPNPLNTVSGRFHYTQLQTQWLAQDSGVGATSPTFLK